MGSFLPPPLQLQDVHCKNNFKKSNIFVTMWLLETLVMICWFLNILYWCGPWGLRWQKIQTHSLTIKNRFLRLCMDINKTVPHVNAISWIHIGIVVCMKTSYPAFWAFIVCTDHRWWSLRWQEIQTHPLTNRNIDDVSMIWTARIFTWHVNTIYRSQSEDKIQ